MTIFPVEGNFTENKSSSRSHRTKYDKPEASLSQIGYFCPNKHDLRPGGSSSARVKNTAQKKGPLGDLFFHSGDEATKRLPRQDYVLSAGPAHNEVKRHFLHGVGGCRPRAIAKRATRLPASNKLLGLDELNHATHDGVVLLDAQALGGVSLVLGGGVGVPSAGTGLESHDDA